MASKSRGLFLVESQGFLSCSHNSDNIYVDLLKKKERKMKVNVAFFRLSENVYCPKGTVQMVSFIKFSDIFARHLHVKELRPMHFFSGPVLSLRGIK